MSQPGSRYRRALWLLTLLSAVGAYGSLQIGLYMASSAPQQAAAAAMAMASAVIPYVLARATDELFAAGDPDAPSLLERGTVVVVIVITAVVATLTFLGAIGATAL